MSELKTDEVIEQEKKDALHHDLKYFTAACISGLLANPRALDPAYQKNLRDHKTSVERMAFETAMNLLEMCARHKAAMSEHECPPEKTKPMLVE